MSQISAGLRRAWKDAKAWGRTLQRLPHLKEFALRTSLPFTRVTGKIDQERIVISQWGGCKVPHPSLRRIVVWHSYGTPEDRIIVWERCWTPGRCELVWEKTSDFEHPDASLFP